ncbi:MAG: aminomethyl transferase family protein [Albidovulum sp.]|nr:aminomethyl transferase family protein [Albidovulum sp.]MDE0307178.1 aminomethyl transferase family protein [Albidovulum sp.]MDE0531906.1 aminomethyl transferase family protein [Albidovulum sp.]
MAVSTLEDRLQERGDPVRMLRNASLGPYQFPISSEFTNWRDEQEAWRNGAVLFDQSFHMTDHYIEGPDVKRLMQHLAINSMANFRRDVAKQVVFCNYDGFVIGDAIMFILEDEKVNIVNKPINRNWVQFHIDMGDYDVEATTDFRALDNTGRRIGYRFEVQGPNAWAILEKLNGGPIEGFRFFGMGAINVAGRRVRALRHGMAGAAGLELFGPFEDYDRVRDAILDAGHGMGLLAAGSKSYSTVAHESGWFPSPLPAIYSGESMRPYREWLPADGFEANLSLGGSLVSENIEDYYLTPYDLGYGHIVNFEHEFIGRDALLAKRDRLHRQKRTLRWSRDDVLRIFASMLQEGDRYKFLDMPASHYATCPYDLVNRGGMPAGLSHYPVYSANVRGWISLALLEGDAAEPGTEVSLVWGEPDGGTRKPTVERHVQTEVACIVDACPVSVSARETYKS